MAFFPAAAQFARRRRGFLIRKRRKTAGPRQNIIYFQVVTCGYFSPPPRLRRIAMHNEWEYMKRVSA
jgi:hypothetical protein